MRGTALLLGAQLRRDAWQVLAWSVGLALLYWSQAVSVDRLYETRADFEQAAASMEGNPAFIAMTGPTRALDTVGGQVAWQSAAFGAVLAGLMSMFLVVRHTRGAEEGGRDELVRAAPVGRFAGVAAAMLEAAVAQVIAGTAVALALVTYPLEAADSVAMGVGLALTGWCFAGLALLAAQLGASARSAYALVGVGLAAAYALRAVGDVGAPALSWLSPIGWYQAMHAFSGLRWWPALLLLAGTAITVAGACWVLVRRDHGSGVLADRPGPARAGPSLDGAFGLAWRLQRTSVAAWAAGLFVAGLAYGSIGDDVEDLLGSSGTTRELFAADAAGDLVAAFQATSVLTLALLSTAFTISSALRPRAEEGRARVDALLATGLSRSRWWWGHAAVTITGTLVVLLAAGLGLGVGYAAVTGRWGKVAELTAATLPYSAPALVLAGVTWTLHGITARAAPLGWAGLGVAFVVMVFGDLMNLPAAVQGLSPFEHLALVPLERFRVTPVLLTAVLAGLLAAAGRRLLLARDLG
ncbi:ABC transporter permease [Nocardioides ochotonae]|uniref:ABC transporter permease n=1 Tax=Nocardioides ochotonae TaxID=2685869 RepID=UPI00140DA86E|nr:ABC transporter permease [Nocardioides ochotonae]